MTHVLPLPCVLAACLLAACAPKPIAGLHTYAYAGGEQQEGRLSYHEQPPAGGAYSPLWQRCGVYAAPLYDEYAVHSLERGAVWVTYRPGLAAADVERLRALLSQPRTRADGQRAVPASLLSPRAGLPAKVVMTVWNAQLQVDSATDPRLGALLDRSSRSPSAPQAAAGCVTSTTETQ